jgi:hypothetical protein
MKNFIQLVMVLIAGALATCAYSQPMSNNAAIKLLIHIETNSISVESRPIVFIQITNCSANLSCSFGDYPIIGASLFITNGVGAYYEFKNLRSPSWDRSFYHPRSHIVRPNESYEWTLRFQVGQDIPPGKYQIIATRLVSINGSLQELESNLQEVELR